MHIISYVFSGNGKNLLDLLCWNTWDKTTHGFLNVNLIAHYRIQISDLYALI